MTRMAGNTIWTPVFDWIVFHVLCTEILPSYPTTRPGNFITRLLPGHLLPGLGIAKPNVDLFFTLNFLQTESEWNDVAGFPLIDVQFGSLNCSFLSSQSDTFNPPTSLVPDDTSRLSEVWPLVRSLRRVCPPLVVLGVLVLELVVGFWFRLRVICVNPWSLRKASIFKVQSFLHS